MHTQEITICIYKNIQDKASRALGEALYQGLDI